MNDETASGANRVDNDDLVAMMLRKLGLYVDILDKYVSFKENAHTEVAEVVLPLYSWTPPTIWVSGHLSAAWLRGARLRYT